MSNNVATEVLSSTNDDTRFDINLVNYICKIFKAYYSFEDTITGLEPLVIVQRNVKLLNWSGRFNILEIHGYFPEAVVLSAVSLLKRSGRLDSRSMYSTVKNEAGIVTAIRFYKLNLISLV